MLSPIVLFVYNRPEHTCRTIEALKENEFASDSVIYIFADGPKQDATEEQLSRISNVRKIIHTITGFKDIIIEESEHNKGLANSVIGGVTKIIKQHGKVIVVEDDLLTHPFFLRFMNEALDYYENEKRIFTIGGMTDKINIPASYKKNILVSQRVESWGWATWADRWLSAEWDITKYSIWGSKSPKEVSKLCRWGDDLWSMLQSQAQGKSDSWAVRWQYNMSKQDKYCLRPVCSFVTNVGLDGSGVHCGASDTGIAPAAPLYDRAKYEIKFEHNIEENRIIRRNYKQLYAVNRSSILQRLRAFVKRILMGFLHEIVVSDRVS